MFLQFDCKNEIARNHMIEGALLDIAQYGTKGALHPLPNLQNNEPVPQGLKQVENLSCYILKLNCRNSLAHSCKWKFVF